MLDKSFKDVHCPECQSENVIMLSLFGSSVSEVMFECQHCRTVFNWVKWTGALPPTAAERLGSTDEISKRKFEE